MTKHRQVFHEMLNANERLFSGFKEIHDKYLLNPDKWQKEFNAEGTKVVDIIRKYESILCGHCESGQYGKYSANLSDKFWILVKAYFPKIDFVGVE